MSDSTLVRQVISKEKKRYRKMLFLLIVLAALVFLFCIFTGRYNCSITDVLAAFMYGIFDVFVKTVNVVGTAITHHTVAVTNPISVNWDKNVDILLWTVRVPRIIAVFVIGAGLSVSGANYQSLFQNPLVSESILGVSSGAALGACIGLLFRLGNVSVSTLAFVFGIAAVAMTYSTSRVFRGNPTMLLVLTGVVVNSLFSAGVSIIKYVAPADSTLPEITFWLMGSFASLKRENMVVLLPIIVLCSIVLFRYRWQLNVLALGEDEAKALGVHTHKIRLIIILCATIITALSVCICGMIGWIGASVPQITRMIIGPDMKKLIPCSFIIGGIFLMIVDLLCRTLLITEIPIGIVTSLIGAPVYLFILHRVKEGWS